MRTPERRKFYEFFTRADGHYKRPDKRPARLVTAAYDFAEPPLTELCWIKYARGNIGVPVTSKPKEKDRDERSKSDPKHVISALFEESGEVASVDFRQFGKRAGEIIAQATRPPHRKPH